METPPAGLGAAARLAFRLTPGKIRLAGLIAFLAVAAIVGLRLNQAGLLQPESLKTAIAGLGPWAPIGYIGIGIAFVLLALPSWTTTVLAGYLFGPIWGALFAILAATVGATLAFLIARGIGRETVQARLGPKLRKFDEGLATRGFRYMLMVRLIPGMPFSGLSYSAGVTRVGFVPYVLATLIGAIPMAALYSYLGSSAGTLLQSVLGH